MISSQEKAGLMLTRSMKLPPQTSNPNGNLTSFDFFLLKCLTEHLFSQSRGTAALVSAQRSPLQNGARRCQQPGQVSVQAPF